MKDTNDKRAARAARYFVALFVFMFALGAAVSFAQTQPAQEQFTPQAEDPDQYPDAPGRDDAFYACGGCHAFRLVASQGLTRERWNETISYMTERHGMPKLEGKDRELILDYLAKTYPPKPEQNRGFQNPFLKQ
jgi:hypothetical protein